MSRPYFTKKDKEFIEEFGLHETMFPYKKDSSIDEISGLIVKDSIRMDMRLAAIKNKVLPSVVSSVKRDKVYGMYQHKIYYANEAASKAFKHVGVLYKELMQVFKENGLEYVTSKDVKDLVESKAIVPNEATPENVNLEPLLTTIASLGIKNEIKRRPKIFSITSNKKIDYNDYSQISAITDKLERGILLNSISEYEELPLTLRGKVRKYAELMSEDVIKVYGKEVYVVDPNEVREFIHKIR
jgi:hypothetical protein